MHRFIPSHTSSIPFWKVNFIGLCSPSIFYCEQSSKLVIELDKINQKQKQHPIVLLTTPALERMSTSSLTMTTMMILKLAFINILRNNEIQIELFASKFWFITLLLLFVPMERKCYSRGKSCKFNNVNSVCSWISFVWLFN